MLQFKVNLSQWEPLTIETVPVNGKISWNIALCQDPVAVFFSLAPIPRPAIIPDVENQRQVEAKRQLNLSSECGGLHLFVSKTPEWPKVKKIRISHSSPCRIVKPALTNCNNSRPSYKFFQPLQQGRCQLSCLLRVTSDGKVNPPVGPCWLNLKDPPVSWKVEVGYHPSHHVALHLLPVPGISIKVNLSPLIRKTCLEMVSSSATSDPLGNF